MRAEAETGTNPGDTPEALEHALRQFGFLLPGQALDDLPDVIEYDD